MGLVMYKYNLIVIIFFTFSLQIFGQNKTPLVISENIFHQNYRQNSGMLFCDSSNGFLVRWEDYRYGTPTYFAQKYDTNSDKIGDKFGIKNYFIISYPFDNKLFGVLRKTYSNTRPDWDIYGVNYLGSLFNEEQIESKTIDLGGGNYPWCGTGWPGEGIAVSRFKDEILAATDFGGTFRLNKIYSDGTDSLIIPHVPSEGEFGYSVATAYNNKGEGLLAYFGKEDYDSAAGIWIQSYSVDNNLISKKRIKDIQGDRFDWGIRLNLIVNSVDDSLFQLLYIDSLQLKSIVTDIQGNILKENEYEILYRNEFQENIFYSNDKNLILFSNINNGTRTIIIQLQEYPNMTSNSLYNFGRNGDIIDAPLFDTLFTYQITSQFFQDENHNLFSTAIINNKVYLIKFNKNFNIIDSTLISNEPANSNELQTRITKYKEDQFFISYRNEVKTVGRFVSKDGNPISEEKEIDSQSLQFFNDGTSLQIWSKKEENYKITKGFYILDSEFNIIKTDSLVVNYDNYYGFCSATISPNDEFIIVYQNINGVFAAKYNKDGNEIKTVRLSEDNRGAVGARTFFDGTKTFVYWNNYIHAFNEEFVLEKISDKYVYSIFAYLGNDKFAASQYDWQAKRSSYSVFNSNGDTLLTDITTIYRENEDPRVMGYAKNDEFIVFYLQDNKLFANTYNSKGETIVDKFIIHDAENEVVKYLSFKPNGNKVLFGWSGKQKGEYDFDTYCVSYDIDLLTEVEKNNTTDIITEYKLEQNYPNPFNPTTTITYQIPEYNFVKLVVYNTLGQIVTTLVNEQQSSGKYSIQFNASNLPTGVYFYQLESGNYKLTNKMLLLR